MPPDRSLLLALGPPLEPGPVPGRRGREGRPDEHLPVLGDGLVSGVLVGLGADRDRRRDVLDPDRVPRSLEPRRRSEVVLERLEQRLRLHAALREALVRFELPLELRVQHPLRLLPLEGLAEAAPGRRARQTLGGHLLGRLRAVLLGALARSEAGAQAADRRSDQRGLVERLLAPEVVAGECTVWAEAFDRGTRGVR